MDYMVVDENGKIIDFHEEKDKKIIFYGASTRNKMVIEELGIKKNVLFYVDTNADKAGETLDGYPIKTAETIFEYPDAVIISVLIKYANEVLHAVAEYGNHCFFFILIEFHLSTAKKVNMDIINRDFSFKYVHFFRYTLFIKSFYMMLEKEFNIKEHLFIINYTMRNDVFSILNFIHEKNQMNCNIVLFDSIHCSSSDFLEDKINCNAIYFSDKMDAIFNRADKIFLHSAFLEDAASDFMCSVADSYSDKMAWLSWGGDAYFEEISDAVKELIRGLKYAYVPAAKCRDAMNYYHLKTPPRVKRNIYFYIWEKDKEPIKKHNGIHILLGHSGKEYVNHEYGMKLLMKYKDEDIKIFAPLVYGESIEHREKIVKLGKEYFGEKFIPMFDYMEQSQYYNFLQEIDIGVFPMNKACAGTTLLYLTAIGKKVYMSSEIAIYFHNSNMEISSEDIEELKASSFEEFIKDLDSKRNREEKIEKINKVTIDEVRRILNDH